MGWSSSYIDLLTPPPIGTIQFAVIFGDDPTDHPSPKTVAEKRVEHQLVGTVVAGEQVTERPDVVDDGANYPAASHPR